ncbi:hypothetical protein Acr_00g0011400 [Actinidia rufa]|uniref:Uncharacterized protein n=1 Tax=Actinidia rufa TaxID=165716 RepID=A0A7J0D9E8_9ERIC|nr:hypothetical protein Acr_00g0011400 [Actinidia rufa]
MGLKAEQRVEGGVVVVKPKPSKGLTSKAVDWFEKLIVKLMYDSSQPHQWLSGNFAPVSHETPPCKDVPVIGHLPESEEIREAEEMLINMKRRSNLDLPLKLAMSADDT